MIEGDKYVNPKQLLSSSVLETPDFNISATFKDVSNMLQTFTFMRATVFETTGVWVPKGLIEEVLRWLIFTWEKRYRQTNNFLLKSVQSALSDLLTTSATHGTFPRPGMKRGLISIIKLMQFTIVRFF